MRIDGTDPLTITLDTALERYAVRKALRHRTGRLISAIDGARDGHLKRLWEGELEVCQWLTEAMPEVSGDELRAEARTDDNPRGGTPNGRHPTDLARDGQG